MKFREYVIQERLNDGEWESLALMSLDFETAVKRFGWMVDDTEPGSGWQYRVLESTTELPDGDTVQCVVHPTPNN